MIVAIASAEGVIAEDDRPVPWWSFTKTVLAAAALALVADRRLRLDEALPGRPYSLRQLLHHRSGVVDYGRLPAYHEAVERGDEPWPVAELLERTQAARLSFAPGQGFLYSNIGYLFVSELIEAAAAEPLAPALRRLVLEPLGIASVSVARLPADLDGTAWGNARHYHPGWVFHHLLVGPAASAALLLHRLLAGALLPQTLLAQMMSPHPLDGWHDPSRPWRSAGYGLGLMIGEGEPPGLYAGHTGAGPGSTGAVYQRQDDGIRRTAAVFAPLEEQGVVERRSMTLAAGA